MNRWARSLLGKVHGLLPMSRLGNDPGRTLVGIYGVPRGGTNFIASHLHYHPEVFCVIEHELDWRLPLALYWKRRSVMREDGWQRKRKDRIRRIVFNKVQRGGPLWAADADYPEGSRFLFYFRNPIRCHFSREAFLRKVGSHPFGSEEEGFESLLADFHGMLETRVALSRRFPCFVLGHEHLCCRFDTVLRAVLSFLEVSPDARGGGEAFFERCGRCGGPLSVRGADDGRWFHCDRCDRRVFGSGHFNPLRPIDLDEIRSDRWKEHPRSRELDRRVREVLGDAIADYYDRGGFEENIPVP